MVEFYQTIKEDLITIFFKLFQDVESEGTVPNSFCEDSVTFITKSNKDVKEERITDQYH
jgi:hypothetical protein